MQRQSLNLLACVLKAAKTIEKMIKEVNTNVNALKTVCKKGEVESDSFLQSMDKKLNPLLTPSDSKFDKVNEDVDALMHVISMHPYELFDIVIKPMFDLEIAQDY